MVPPDCAIFAVHPHMALSTLADAGPAAWPFPCARLSRRQVLLQYGRRKKTLVRFGPSEISRSKPARQFTLPVALLCACLPQSAHVVRDKTAGGGAFVRLGKNRR